MTINYTSVNTETTGRNNSAITSAPVPRIDYTVELQCGIYPSDQLHIHHCTEQFKNALFPEDTLYSQQCQLIQPTAYHCCSGAFTPHCFIVVHITWVSLLFCFSIPVVIKSPPALTHQETANKRNKCGATKHLVRAPRGSATAP